ncbi:MAG TPA: hypothetical protein VFH00_05230 [Candidatus Nitrosotalea sp.]|nr:hypothetical protein [Candidatus Nitrosotalea sp.]
MLFRLAVVASAFALSACAISPSSSKTSPRPTAQPIVTSSATASPSAATSAGPTAPGTPGGAGLVRCDAAIPAGDTLVIGRVGEDSTIVVRDIQDPANAKTLCRFDSGAQSPQFISATQVAYATASNQIVKADIAAGTTTVLATIGAGFGSGQLSFSADGKSYTYIDGNTWHLVTAAGNRVLTTLPPVPARGFNPDEDDSFLSYSPDDLYIALVQTVHTGGTGQTAPVQVRKASDGTLVYSTTGMTMGVWASAPSRLFFRDTAGTVHRWDPTTGASTMLPLKWIRPKASPDGRWIAYTFRTSNVDAVGYYSVQGNAVSNTSPPARSSPRFLTNDLVWYIGEKPCDTCFGGLPTPTGLTYIYSLAGASEVISRLSGLIDVWPRYGGPPAGVG